MMVYVQIKIQALLPRVDYRNSVLQNFNGFGGISSLHEYGSVTILFSFLQSTKNNESMHIPAWYVTSLTGQ